jgi:hypothetical protein
LPKQEKATHCRVMPMHTTYFGRALAPTQKNIDQSVDQLQWAIILSCYQNCPDKTTRSPRMVPWWNKELSGLRAKTRELFNTAKRTSQWDTYKETVTCYNKEIRRAK